MPKALLSPGRIAVVVTVFAVAVGVAATGGGLFSPGKLSAEQKGRVQLGGVNSHADLGGKCSACHVPPWSRQTMSDRCLECHTDVRGQIDAHQPLHGKLTNNTQCRNCHTEHKGDRAAITDLNAFDHNCAAFALTGKHASVECNACHTSGPHKGTPATCGGCHGEPKAHLGKFGIDCIKCHSTSTWHSTSFTTTGGGGGGAFDHSRTAFPLTGHHTTVDCKKCHINDKFKGTPTSCVSCHAEPKVHMSKFGTDCVKCHTTATWHRASFPTDGPGAGFDHSRTAFPLTGHHTTVDCKKCHVNDKFKGTATTCVSCHAEPKVHLGKFGKDCNKCHTTSEWTGATLGDFKHTFPITHGRKNRGASACNVCHKGEDAYKTYTCYGCHEHNPANIARRHKNVANLDNCVKCHKGGRGRERMGMLGVDGDALCLGCPMDPDALLVDDEPMRCPGAPGRFHALNALSRSDNLFGELGDLSGGSARCSLTLTCPSLDGCAGVPLKLDGPSREPIRQFARATDPLFRDPMEGGGLWLGRSPWTRSGGLNEPEAFATAKLNRR
jgi:hypothetical protein